MLPARRALLSVSDKTGLADFARGLVGLGIEVVSTGGTLRHLADAGVPVTAVSDVTGFPEVLDGRVKTLHPRVHGGILADRGKPAHLAALDEHGIGRIDVVAVNLYAFRETVRDAATTLAAGIEQIDVAAPPVARRAKNFAGVRRRRRPGRRSAVLAALQSGAGVAPEPLRLALATKAFVHTQAYDAAIAGWLADRSGAAEGPLPAGAGTSADDSAFPPRLELALSRELTPRYGENPHQPARCTSDESGPACSAACATAAAAVLEQRARPDDVRAAGLAVRRAGGGDHQAQQPVRRRRRRLAARAYDRALRLHPSPPSAVDRAVTARPMPSSSRHEQALRRGAGGARLRRRRAAAAPARKENLRVLACPAHRFRPGAVELRPSTAALPRAGARRRAGDPAHLTCPTARSRPTPSGEPSRSPDGGRHVKSNAIVLANGGRRGDRAGQMSRVDLLPARRREGAASGNGSVAARMVLPLQGWSRRPRRGRLTAGGPSPRQQARRRSRPAADEQDRHADHRRRHFKH